MHEINQRKTAYERVISMWTTVRETSFGNSHQKVSDKTTKRGYINFTFLKSRGKETYCLQVINGYKV